MSRGLGRADDANTCLRSLKDPRTKEIKKTASQLSLTRPRPDVNDESRRMLESHTPLTDNPPRIRTDAARQEDIEEMRVR